MKSFTETKLSLIAIFLCLIYWLSRGQGTGDLPSKKHKGIKSHAPSQGDSPIATARVRQPSSKQEIPGAGGVIPANEDSHASSSLLVGYSAAFPRVIYQTSSQAQKVQYAENIKTWQALKRFDHQWLSDNDADEFVHDQFSNSRPSLVAFWDDLSSGMHNDDGRVKDISEQEEEDDDGVMDSSASSAVVLRTDLLRYMLMLARGGVYADIDTSVLVHVDSWIPDEFGSQFINAIIGIEYDDTSYPMFVRPVSFCQWTLMSKPGHPIFVKAVDRVVSNLEFLARQQKLKSLSQLKLGKMDVLEATGPGMISDVVLSVIRDQSPEQNITWATFHNQKTAKLYGDVLILPINGFGGSQKHSHAGHPDYGEMLVAHHFGRSWYRQSKPAVTR